MRILLADGHPQLRRALRSLLARQAGIEIVGEAADSDGLLAQVASSCPDLVLMDWGLPDARPEALMASLRQTCADIRVVVLSAWPEARRAAMAAGADGFASKGDPPEVLLAAIMSRAGATP